MRSSGLGIAAVAALATGCVSTSKFDEHVASADAAIKAAQQSAAAAQAAAAPPQSRFERRQHGERRAEHRQPGAAGRSGLPGVLRRDQREDRSRLQALDGQVIARAKLRDRRETPRRPRGVFLLGVDTGAGTPLCSPNACDTASQSTATGRPSATVAMFDCTVPYSPGPGSLPPSEQRMALDVQRAAQPADLGRLIDEVHLRVDRHEAVELCDVFPGTCGCSRA